MPKDETFESKMSSLEEIVNQLEKGDVPLEEALEQYKKGINLSTELQDILNSAEKTLTKTMTDSGEEVQFSRDEDENESN